MAHGITVALCAAAVMLLCKPAVQAWRLGRTLDATLDAAFGAPPAPPPCRPFSLAAALVPRNPAPVAIETLQYADGLASTSTAPPGRGTLTAAVRCRHSWSTSTRPAGADR